MAQAKDYPVSFPYGATTAPYTPSNPHKGDDRAMPKGTPILINGVQIGTSGQTGFVTGPHLHTGKWANGRHYNPNGQGFTFNEAIVTQIDTLDNDANGRYVRVQADGYSWVYLHMDTITCSVGQRLTAPVSEYPKWVRVKSGWGAYVRSAPNTSAPLAGSRFLPFGTPFRVAGIVTGQSVGGNNKWYKSMYGNYIWSGNAG
jgi:hypothetical protein